MLRSIINFLILATALPCFAQPTTLDTSIRRVNWDSLLRHDRRHFEFDTDASSDINQDYYQFLGMPNWMDGGGSIDSVNFIDLNHDGFEDAILNFSHAGSCICASIVIYLESEHAPILIGWDGNSHFEWRVSNDTIYTTTDHFLLADANCCARAHDLRSYIIRNMKLISLPLRVEPAEHGGISTVQIFYSELGMGYPKEAYGMLSPSYRRQHSYRNWFNEFGKFKYAKYDGAKVDWEAPDTGVSFTVVAFDTGKHEHHFQGTWHPYWDPKAHNWFLDRPEIQEVREKR